MSNGIEMACEMASEDSDWFSFPPPYWNASLVLASPMSNEIEMASEDSDWSISFPPPLAYSFDKTSKYFLNWKNANSLGVENYLTFAKIKKKYKETMVKVSYKVNLAHFKY
jgi:hypothetical protein